MHRTWPKCVNNDANQRFRHVVVALEGWTSIEASVRCHFAVLSDNRRESNCIPVRHRCPHDPQGGIGAHTTRSAAKSMLIEGLLCIVSLSPVRGPARARRDWVPSPTRSDNVRASLY